MFKAIHSYLAILRSVLAWTRDLVLKQQSSENVLVLFNHGYEKI